MFLIPRAKGVWLIVVFLGLLLIGTHGPELFKASEKEVTFEKVQEKTYDEFIEDIAFGSTVKDGKEQIYCKVIVLEEKEVQFLDESGKVVSRKPLSADEFTGEKYCGKRAILSRNGNFVAIHDYTRKIGDPVDHVVEEEYSICNDKGEEIYKIKGPIEWIGLEDRLLISDHDGSAVGTRIEYGALDFYTPAGLTRTVPIFGEAAWGRRAGYAAFSRDGEYLAVLVREIPKPSAGGIPSLEAFEVWIILFDRTGSELWRRKVEEQQIDMSQPQKIAIADGGQYLFFKAFSIRGGTPPRKAQPDLASVTLSLFDREGKEVSFGDTSLFSFSSFCFSPQADYLGLGGRNLIKLIRTEDASTVFEEGLPGDLAIRDLLFSGDGEYLIVRAKAATGIEKITERAIPGREHRTVYTNRVFVLSLQGDPVWNNDFPELREIFSDKAFIAFSFPHRYEIYERVERDKTRK